MNQAKIRELMLQALETELGGVQVYKTALLCAVHDDLREEWEKYYDQTVRHVEIMKRLCRTLDIDPDEITPGRMVVKHLGEGLVQAMRMALQAGKPGDAQITAAECVVLAETKDHQNWSLISELAKNATGEVAEALTAARDEVEEQEDEHYYHTKGWCRELWIDALGMPAVLPPPEEERDVKSAEDAAKAKKARKQML